MKSFNPLSLTAWLLAGFLFVQETPAYARQAAIAFSPSTGAYGTAWNYDDEFAAESSAIASCGQSDCQIEVRVSNACASLATGDNNGLGWAWNRDLGTSENAAINACNGRTTNCRILAWVCSG